VELVLPEFTFQPDDSENSGFFDEIDL